MRESKLPVGAVKAIKLNDGDIITIFNITVLYEEKLFHEVRFDGYDDFMQTVWIKTGTFFSMEGLNEYCKKGD
ncbi:hypothetical protein M5X00_25885 [Paenibacillus alvei]|uniref:hypothetical protein n=1 Tax=Paenibacillus alvei TaxID=44250 RepID=UPI002281463A|nr:hypothetical protein [Paenibacillus alvei]MCY9757661.1 hypothetical protein [Paenibacillus alvei]